VFIAAMRLFLLIGKIPQPGSNCQRLCTRGEVRTVAVSNAPESGRTDFRRGGNCLCIEAGNPHLL